MSACAALAILLAGGAAGAQARLGGWSQGPKVMRGSGRGVVYRRGAVGARAAQRQASTSCSVSCAGPLEYHGGPVLHAHTTYTIYWEPAEAANNGQSGTSLTPFPAGYESTVNGFLANVAAASTSHALSNVYSTDLQYGEPASGVYESTFGKGFRDAKPYPTRTANGECPTSSNNGADGLPPAGRPCLTDAQIQAEIKLFVSKEKLPEGLGAMYFLLTPEGVASCAGGKGTEAECSTNVYCAYHYQTASPLLIYANMPYDHVSGCSTPAEPNSTPADDEINTLSHEHNEAVTDPTGFGWYYGEYVEDGDKCTYPFFNPAEDSNEITDAYGPLLEGSSGSTAFNQVIDGGHYLLQREWSNAAGGCVTQAPVPVASFAVYTNPATVGQGVAFNASASTPSAGAITSYHWEFGDRQTAEGAEVKHTYTTEGSFTVRLTVTNDSGASASATRTVTVSEPPPGGQTTTVTTTVTTPPPPPVTTTVTTTTTTPVPPPGAVTTTVTTPAPPPANVTKVFTGPTGATADTAEKLAAKLGLPGNGGKLSGNGPFSLGHAECPPACGVALRLYAREALVVRKRRTSRWVLVGSAHVSLAAKGSGALVVSLNAKGRALLHRLHRTRGRLVVTVEGREGGTWQIVRSLTLSAGGKAARRARR